jgi:hypothetical protein
MTAFLPEKEFALIEGGKITEKNKNGEGECY